MTKNLDSVIETPETLTQKVERLERRVSTLEMLLNDVMIQLDKPFKNEKQFVSKQKPNGKPPSKGNPPKAKGKPKRNGKPRDQKPPGPQRDHKSKNLTKAGVPVDLKEIDKKPYLALKRLLSGGAKLTRSAIFEAIPGLTKKIVQADTHSFFKRREQRPRETTLLYQAQKLILGFPA